MIRAKVTAVSASRDTVIEYLYKAINHDQWKGWTRIGDLHLTMRRPALKAPTWFGYVNMQRDET
jgi:hypothetical protein